MNTSGGLILLYSNRPGSDRKRDKWIMGFESVLTNNWISESLLQSLVRYRYIEIESQLRIYMFVNRSQHLVTFNFHAFGRRATGVRPIKDWHRIQQMLNEADRSASGRECSSQMKDLTKGEAFKLNDPIPVNYRESETMEFKHCYFGTSEKSELPGFDVTKLKHRLGEYFEYLSAFANTQGGSLVIGVEESEKYPVIRGFPVTQNQEADEASVTEYLEKRLEKCIWHGDPEYKPVMGQDWGVFYHKVVEEDGGERKMIEVRVTKHCGGMFLQPPLHYVVKGNGDIEENTVYNEWNFHFQTDTFDMDKNDKQSYLKKHVGTAGTELSDNSTIPNVPHDQPQPDIVPNTAVESKLPKSFKESQSEYKSDIVVHGLNIHECCINKMIKHIQTYAGDNVWLPLIEHILKRLPGDALSEQLMTYLQTIGWHGVASVINIENISDTTNRFDLAVLGAHRLICHVLIITENEPPMMMCCIRDNSLCNLTEQDIEKLVGYALDSGRALKRKFLMSTATMQHQSCLFHFDVKVLLVPPTGDVRTVWDSRDKQPVKYPSAKKDTYYTIGCDGLAEELLKTRASVKDRYGQVLIEHLTEAQAKVLLAKPERVLVVNGKSGTGKTVIALHLMIEAMQEGSVEDDVVYICSNDGLKAFVSSQVLCKVIVLKSTNALTLYEKNILEKAKLIIVDDVHAIEVSEHWETNPDDLYLKLFTHATRPNTRVAVFVDKEQDYMKHLPVNFDKRLRDLGERVSGMLSEDIRIVTLKERIRNSHEINRFMQANQNQARIAGTIECLNERPGDDVIYEYLGSSLEQSANILNARLEALVQKYDAASVAILCDATEQLDEMKTLLTENFNKKFQKVNEYPIQHMVMCSLQEFGGLEAEVILFLLPQNFGKGEVNVSWKYVNVISSRARERLEFLLPWDPISDCNEDQEQHEKLADLLELFTMVSQKKSFSCEVPGRMCVGLRWLECCDLGLVAEWTWGGGHGGCSWVCWVLGVDQVLK